MSHITLPRLRKILSGFRTRRVVVVGDLMLDRFIWGTVSRISPEAPIPVVEVESTSQMPGGAANVVNNVSALGGTCYACGAVGKDVDGTELLKLLRAERVDTRAIVSSSRIRTTVKTRVIAHHQHVVRIDTENTSPVDGRIAARIINSIRSRLAGLEAIILEDYGKGVLTTGLVRLIIDLTRDTGIIVTADPKIDHDLDYTGVSVVTPNRAEAYHFAGRSTRNRTSLEEVGAELLKKWNGTPVLITLGEEGMCLFESRKKPKYITTSAREVFDVAGAGDTVIAAMTMAMVSGATLQEAAAIANLAAGIVVQKKGVSSATCAEIVDAAKALE
jgi:D-beta-D-heptose 7-phosphate kinase/D-beta-D-heptose 1-phosphate adenosyltransferase